MNGESMGKFDIIVALVCFVIGAYLLAQVLMGDK